MMRHLRDGRGFSASELIVVMGLLGAVLSITFTGMFAVYRSNQVNDAQSSAARDFSDPLEKISMIVMQATEIGVAEPYRLVVWTDRDLDGNPERNEFVAGTDSSLTWYYGEYQPDRVGVLEQSTWVMSDNNANRARNTALFRYYRSTGAEILVMGDVPSQAFTVKANMAVEAVPGVPTYDSRNITLRLKS